jgi:hypothetical protein
VHSWVTPFPCCSQVRKSPTVWAQWHAGKGLSFHRCVIVQWQGALLPQVCDSAVARGSPSTGV